MEKYDFSQHLEEGEEILCECRPCPGKGSKNIGGIAVIVGFCVVVVALLVTSLVFGIGDGADGFDMTYLIFFTVIGLFLAIALSSFIYNVFLKKKAVSDDFYCVTNKRVMKYESKKDKFVCGYIENYVHISYTNEKDGYGDITMSVNPDKAGIDTDSVSGMIDFKNMMLHPNAENMPTMTFESVEHPRRVGKIIKEQQRKNAAQ